MLRPSVERREDWASVVARYGGVRASGDGLDQLDSWGLETTRALLRPSPVEVFTPA
jgi:alpha-galactosidase